MRPDRTYRCLNCLEQTVARGFDVSHLSMTCPACDTFERFINDAVFDQFQAFEESPPDAFDWDRLDRREKLLVSERVVRSSHSIDDFEIEEPGQAG